MFCYAGGGALCKTCVLFAKKISDGQGSNCSVGALVKSPFIKYKNAIEAFNAHEKSAVHKTSMKIADSFIATFLGKCDDMQVALDSARKRQVAQNRNRLVPIVQTVIFCGMQELALRGHRDSGPLSISTPSENDGTFRAALRLRLQAGDKVLQHHLDKSAANAAYISWRVQNDIIEECGHAIVRNIVKAMGHSECQNRSTQPQPQFKKVCFPMCHTLESILS